MKIEMEFPGGVAVDARFDGQLVRTDQLAPQGGGTAPSPFDLFLVSLGTCAGFYALRFCQERGIATAGLGVSLETTQDPESKRLSLVAITLTLPADFPEKYRTAIVRAVDQCSVKKAILSPPEMTVKATGVPLGDGF
jgi:ribosomal protein S12 methylthiotransferase accessory factor